MKTPEHILYTDKETGEIQQVEVGALVKHIVKEYNIKDIVDEETGAKKSSNEIIRDLLAANFKNVKNPFELPDELSDLEDVNNHIFELSKEHREIIAEQEQARRDEKEKKAQEREHQKELKEKEDKQYTENQEKFEALFKAQSEKLAKSRDQFVSTVRDTIGKALPKNVSMTENGMGFILSTGATQDDIAKSIAIVSSAYSGNQRAASMMQFLIGDMINESVDKRVYRNQKLASEGIRFRLVESMGAQANYSVGAIQQFALQSRRIPQALRRDNVAPSLYYFAAKIVAPVNKETEKSEAIALQASFDEERNKIIEEINEGKITSQKDLTARVDNFKKEKGLLVAPKESTGAKISRLLRNLFYSTWIKDNLLDEDSNAVLRNKDGTAVRTINVGELSDIQQDAMLNLQSILLKDYDIECLITRTKEIEKEVDGKVEKTTVDYHMEDPFVVEDQQQ